MAWHERIPNYEDFRRFDRIVETHLLTLQWMTDLHTDPENIPHQLSRAQVPQAERHLQWISKWTPSDVLETDLQRVLDGSDSDDILGELDASVDALQIWSLKTLTEKVHKDERSALINQLEQSSWKVGQRSYERRWQGLPQATHTPRDLVHLDACAERAPFSGLLCRRKHTQELVHEWIGCPHQRTADPSGHALGDLRCRLQSHWWRGFTYGYHPQLRFEYTAQADKNPCVLRWSKL